MWTIEKYNVDYTQYELLFKDAQRCGWDDVNPESEEILRDFVFEYIKTNKDVMFFIESNFIKNDMLPKKQVKNANQ